MWDYLNCVVYILLLLYNLNLDNILYEFRSRSSWSNLDPETDSSLELDLDSTKF